MGLSVGKAMAHALKKPLIAVSHLEGHMKEQGSHRKHASSEIKNLSRNHLWTLRHPPAPPRGGNF
ncbi:hypothetical protein [Desulforhabdus amnigena]|uniref:hypothetical protein n=1 Tax=Desulforhabdus amnigena TaxID=40218 RepID=UPI0024919E49|nr:hypothetical protein [Desulforhabdus amnigena]